MARIVTCTPTSLSANGMNHAFAYSTDADPHFTDPEGMEGWVGLASSLHTGPKTIVAHPSTNRARRWLTSLIRPTTLTIAPRDEPVKRLNPHISKCCRCCGLASDLSLSAAQATGTQTRADRL